MEFIQPQSPLSRDTYLCKAHIVLYRLDKVIIYRNRYLVRMEGSLQGRWIVPDPAVEDILLD